MKTISVHTTQFVTIDYQLASIGDRLFAALLDTALFFFGYYVLVFVLLQITSFITNGSSAILSVLLGYLPVFLFLGYHFFANLILDGQTIGKRIMGIRIIRPQDEEPSMLDFGLRTLFLLPELLFTAGSLGLLLLVSTEKRQRLGDLLAGTVVIRNRQRSKFSLVDFQKLQTSTNLELEFEHLDRFSEQDMLTIKKALAAYQKNKNSAYAQVLSNLTEKTAALLEIEAPTQLNQQIGLLKKMLAEYILSTR